MADLEVHTKKADEQSTDGKYQQVYELPKFLYVHNSRFRFIFQKAVYSALILKNRNSYGYL